MTFHIFLVFYQLISKANLTHQFWTGFNERLVDLKSIVKNCYRGLALGMPKSCTNVLCFFVVAMWCLEKSLERKMHRGQNIEVAF